MRTSNILIRAQVLRGLLIRTLQGWPAALLLGTDIVGSTYSPQQNTSCCRIASVQTLRNAQIQALVLADNVSSAVLSPVISLQETIQLSVKFSRDTLATNVSWPSGCKLNVVSYPPEISVQVSTVPTTHSRQNTPQSQCVSDAFALSRCPSACTILLLC